MVINTSLANCLKTVVVCVKVHKLKVVKVTEFSSVHFTHWVATSKHELSNSLVIDASLADSLESIVVCIKVLEVDYDEVLHFYQNQLIL